jgi:hypothetical protein
LFIVDETFSAAMTLAEACWVPVAVAVAVDVALDDGGVMRSL